MGAPFALGIGALGPRGLCRPLDEKQAFPTNTSPLAPCQGCSKAEQSRTTFREEIVALCEDGGQGRPGERGGIWPVWAPDPCAGAARNREANRGRPGPQNLPANTMGGRQTVEIGRVAPAWDPCRYPPNANRVKKFLEEIPVPQPQTPAAGSPAGRNGVKLGAPDPPAGTPHTPWRPKSFFEEAGGLQNRVANPFIGGVAPSDRPSRSVESASLGPQTSLGARPPQNTPKKQKTMPRVRDLGPFF